ncbi:MAG: accessory gene regulator B family protein [archaeon]
MIYKKIVYGLSNYIAGELNFSDKKKDKIRFGLEILISQCISLSVAIIISYLLGISNMVLTILLVTASLRLNGGGTHFETVFECVLFTTVFTNIFGLFAFVLDKFILLNEIYLLIFSLIILILFYLWSPAKVEKKPIKDKKKKRKLKLLSILIGCLWLIICLILVWLNKYIYLISGIISGLLLHTFSISPLAYKFNTFYYKIKSKFV